MKEFKVVKQFRIQSTHYPIGATIDFETRGCITPRKVFFTVAKEEFEMIKSFAQTGLFLEEIKG